MFSMAFSNENDGVIVGGCYLDSTSTIGNCSVTNNGGKSWSPVTEKPPLGYRSCVANIPGTEWWIVVGRTGTDYSKDNGRTWTSLSNEGYFACAFSENVGWAVGRNGKMAKMGLR